VITKIPLQKKCKGIFVISRSTDVTGVFMVIELMLLFWMSI